MEKNDLNTLAQIKNSAEKIYNLVQGFSDYKALKNNEIASDTLFYNLASLIDMVNKLSSKLKEELNDIQWELFAHFEKKVADIRFQFDLETVFKLVVNRFPSFIKALTKHLDL